MTDELGEWEEEQQRRMEAAAQLRLERVLRTRRAQSAADLAGTHRLERQFVANALSKIAKPFPRTEPLNDAETNAHANLLDRQREILMEPKEQTEAEFEARKAELERQKKELLS